MTTPLLPPGPSAPRIVQAISAVTRPLRSMQRARARYGDAFTINNPLFGRALILSNAAEIKQLFQAGPEIADNLEPNLGRVLGPGALFALSGDEHRKQRKLLAPPFHGRRLAAYDRITEQESVREFASWPQSREFPTLRSMQRITINVILRAVFGAEGEELQRLRSLLPPWVKLGSMLMVLPVPTVDWGRWSPWGRFWLMRREYDAIIERMIAKARRDDRLDQREDILALMVQARYDDGAAMSHRAIADQLLALLTAGHETMANTLAWWVERVRRHPDLLRELREEADTGGSALREASITETQRTRPVVELAGRMIKTHGARLGRWTLPAGMVVMASIALIHQDETLFPNPDRFDPHRFVGVKPDLYHWIPFGGGSRRCIGAAFASMEMNVVVRTLLRDFELVPTTEPDEGWHSRGVATAPAKGGLAVVRRRG